LSQATVLRTLRRLGFSYEKSAALPKSAARRGAVKGGVVGLGIGLLDGRGGPDAARSWPGTRDGVTLGWLGGVFGASAVGTVVGGVAG